MDSFTESDAVVELEKRPNNDEKISVTACNENEKVSDMPLQYTVDLTDSSQEVPVPDSQNSVTVLAEITNCNAVPTGLKNGEITANASSNLTKDEEEDPFKEDFNPFEAEISFAEKEAALNAYLGDVEKEKEKKTAQKQEETKPKRNKIAELMKRLPKALLNKKPVIRPSGTDIDLNASLEDYTEKQKAIEKLKHRFDIHTAVTKPQKEEHFKIHITTSKEDSQGVAHMKTDEEDYVKVIPDDAIEEITSPQCQAPGVRLGQMKEKLMNEIRAKRAKAYEEKCKSHSIYTDEKTLDDKKEEVLLDDEDEAELSSEGSDGEEEDEVDCAEEKLEEEESSEEVELGEEAESADEGDELDADLSRKKKRRYVFLEEEADESDVGHSADEDEDKLDKVNRDDIDFIDDRSISDEDELARPNAYFRADSDLSVRNSENVSHGLSAHTGTERDEIVSQDMFSQPSETPDNMVTPASPMLESVSAFLDPNKTPTLSSAIFSRKNSPFGAWNTNIRCSQTYSNNHISPLIPRLNSDTALEALCAETPTSSKASPTIPAAVAKLVGARTPTAETTLDDLEGICSARFPSQQPRTPCESQEYESFALDSSQEDVDKDDPVSSKTGKNGPHIYHGITVTPKTAERQPRVTRLNFDEVPAENKNATMEIEEIDDENDDAGSVVGVKPQRKRKRHLQFSDDEDSEDNKSEKQSDEEDESIQDEEITSDVEYDENEEIIPKSSNGLIDAKTGKLRKDFFEAEAELSGSEEGSADEDEQGLDDYEKEDCDDEEHDEEEIRKQVGRYHLKTLLDDDERAIRALQNQYLEDGDLHAEGQGRERKFKWKFLDKLGIDGLQPSMNEEGIVDGEDETEKRWREEKLEKLRWKKENDMDDTEEVDLEETSQKILENSQFFKVGRKTLRKSKTEMSFSETVVQVENSPTVGFERKGSFLCRETTLTRIAESVKISDTVNTMKAGAKGFVFAMVTPPSDASNSKKVPARAKPGDKGQPKKIMRVDRSFDNLDEAQRSKSIFKFMS